MHPTTSPLSSKAPAQPRPNTVPFDSTAAANSPCHIKAASRNRDLLLFPGEATMNGDAHAAALTMQQQQQQLLQGMSLPTMATTSFAASSNNKPRLPGLPPTPPQPTFHRADVDPVASKGHRRSRSDVPFGYFAAPGMIMGDLQLPPPKVEAGGWGGGHGDGADDLFNAYLNLDGLSGNSSDDRHDSRGSSSIKTNNSSENEESEEGVAAADSRGAGRTTRLRADAAEGREALKRCAAPMARHARSLSMDSFIGANKFNFSAAAGTAAAAASGIIMPGQNNGFSLEFGSSCDFTSAEMNKIMADEKLAEMALADPKRVKRVLANRQSAARSKERKMRYIAELEQKVQILQTEATTLSAQLTLLQRDSAGIATQNNELKFRLQAMEQQAQLRDALNEALTTEVQRLRLATAELGDSCSSDNLAQQIQLNVQDQMFQLQQATPIPFHHLQQPQQSGAAKNHEPKE